MNIGYISKIREQATLIIFHFCKKYNFDYSSINIYEDQFGIIEIDKMKLSFSDIVYSLEYNLTKNEILKWYLEYKMSENKKDRISLSKYIGK